MKLSNIFSQEYVLVETTYGMDSIDTTSDNDRYEISKVRTVTLKELADDDDTNYVAEKIRELGAEGEELGNVVIYEGTVITASGSEDCTVYAPEFWQ